MNPQEPLYSNTPNFQAPQTEQPVYGQPQKPQKPKWLKPLIIIIALLVLLAIGFGVRALLKSNESKDKGTNTDSQEEQFASTGPRTFTVSYAKDAPSYVGTKVYDACSLLSFESAMSKVEGVPELTDETRNLRPPLSIEHGYTDRDISQILGKDDQPRAKTTTVSDTGIGGTSMDNFTSLANTHCVYGQGKPSSNTFARVFVTQPPTPLTPELLPYLANIPKKQVNGVDVYTVETKDQDGFMSVAMVRADKKMVVILKTGVPALLTSGVDEITQKMTAAPTGPARYQYPGAFGSLINSCSVFTASDFEKFTGKKAASIVSELLVVTQGDELGVDRECSRHEADSVSAPVFEADSAVITIRQGKNEVAAKSYLELEKDPHGNIFNFTPSQTKLGDESYVKAQQGDTESARRSYELIVRVKAAVLEIKISQTAAGDASPAAFEQRIMPAAKVILDNYKKQVKE